PESEMAVSVEVGVHYDSDLSRVEAVTLEVARRVLETVAGGVRGFEPTLRFHAFDASSINFTVTLRVRGFADQALIRHEFIKALHERYRDEGIVIPYPPEVNTVRRLAFVPENTGGRGIGGR
ncbi:MAG: mechanosensitive ion channel family protein, partial [Pseudomonadota bacterium]